MIFKILSGPDVFPESRGRYSPILPSSFLGSVYNLFFFDDRQRFGDYRKYGDRDGKGF